MGIMSNRPQHSGTEPCGTAVRANRFLRNPPQMKSLHNAFHKFVMHAAFAAALTIGFAASAVHGQTATSGQPVSNLQKTGENSTEQLGQVLNSRRLPPITPIPAPANPDSILLYPDARVGGLDEQWENYVGGPICRNVVRPTLTPFLPDPAKSTGAAVIVAPGGGFWYLGMDDVKIAQRLADRGIAAFLLKYRLLPTSRDPQEFLMKMFQDLGEAAKKRDREVQRPRSRSRSSHWRTPEPPCALYAAEPRSGTSTPSASDSWVVLQELS